MKKRKPIIKDKKLRGEWAEMQFMARAAEHGLSVSKPWGEMRPFDFIVGKTGRFASVQVKSTAFQVGAGYGCTIRGGHTAYRAGSFDFVAAFIVPENIWYIIPARKIGGLDDITLYPNSKTSKYEAYREAWQLLREAAEPGEGESREEGAGAVEAVGTARRFPNSALERAQAAANFCKRQLERGGVIRQERDDG